MMTTSGEVPRLTSSNHLKALLDSGRPAVGGWCTIPDSYSAEIVAYASSDYVVVDMQHGLAAFSDLVQMLQAVAAHGPTPLVRIPHGDLATAQRALDAGAQGIIFPLINSAADAAAAVASCRFPPLGTRSYGPVRARLHLGADPEVLNREVLCLVQVETLEAMQALDEILSCVGVDGVYVGPADLALSLGLPVGTAQPAVEDALGTVVTSCRAAGLTPGIHTASGEAARGALERGFQMATVSSDAVLLLAAYQRELATARAVAPATPESQSGHTP